MPTKRSENSYINNDIIPLLHEYYGYPPHGDANKVRINDVPIFRPSGARSGSTIDIVYYHNGVPLLLVEAKEKHKTHESALKQALIYLRDFLKEKIEFSKTGKRPKYLATTIGKDIKFYKSSLNYEIEDFVAEPIEIITFQELLKAYGLSIGYIPQIITAENFKEDFFDELIDVFLPKNRKITSEVIKNVSDQILTYFWDKNNYYSQKPYVLLNAIKARAINDIFRKFDLIHSTGPIFAQSYRETVLRAFQGGGFNQYMTEQCIIDFMVELLGGISTKSKILDFECGSGGFLAAIVNKFNLSLKNIMGIDIDEFPFIIAKTYLALYFKLNGRDKIDHIPVKKDNGLFNNGNNWDIILGNPAGSSEYRHGGLKKIIKEGLRKITSSKGNYSEYELSIQQAIRSVRTGGMICLILTESFFSNSTDELLRKFVVENCKVKAIISLPRGIFKQGTTATLKSKGSRTASMKMSILFIEKISPIKIFNKNKIDFKKLNYNVFLSSINKPKTNGKQICDWLKPELDLVLENWKKLGFK